MSMEKIILECLNYFNLQIRKQNKTELLSSELNFSKEIIRGLEKHIQNEKNSYYDFGNNLLKVKDYFKKIVVPENEEELLLWTDILDKTTTLYNEHNELLRDNNYNGNYFDKSKVDKISKKNIEISNYYNELTSSKEDLNGIRQNISNIKKEIDDYRPLVLSINERLESAKLEAINESKEATLNNLKQHIKEANQTREAIEKLLKQISTTIVTKNYSDASKREKELADIFRASGIVISFATIIFILFFSNIDINTLKSKDIEPVLKYFIYLKPIFISLFGMTLSGFLFKESSKHRSQQILNEQQAYRIDAMTPMLHGIKTENQALIKHDVIKSMFNSENKISIQDDSNSSINSLALIIDKLIPSTKKSD